MGITPLFELLIFIEDKKSVNLTQIDFFPAPVLRGILGKMEAMKLLDREGESYKISKIGQQALNSYLDNLHERTLHWDGKWRFISFSVPELNRSVRDKFRRHLDSLGVKMIMTGLWVTPLNLVEQVTDIAKSLGIYNNLLLIESSEIYTGMSKDEFQKLWNFEKSKKEIYEYIELADIFIKQKNHSAFEIKKMIFQYACILNSQPKLPIELFPSDWPQFRANLAYKKIRRLLS